MSLRDCEHGQLARSCEICEMIAERDAAVARAENAEALMEKLWFYSTHRNDDEFTCCEHEHGPDTCDCGLGEVTHEMKEWRREMRKSEERAARSPLGPRGEGEG